MVLTRSQYDTIMREYEHRRDRSRRIGETRLAEIYKRIPEYRNIDDSIPGSAMAFTRRILSGDPQAEQEMASLLAQLQEKKKNLLTQSGYPADYLEPAYECSLCHDTGYVNGEKCSCFRRRVSEILHEQSHISDLLEKENFSTLSYQYHTGDNRESYVKAVNAAKAFADDFDSHDRNMLFMGTVGTGKSFLCNCIAKALLDTTHSVLYFSAVELFRELADHVFDKEHSNLQDFYDILYESDLVVIDDLGTEQTNSFVCTYLFTFLNERHLRGKSTIISTNLSLRDISDRYSERVTSRIVEYYDICELKTSDIRMQKRKQR